MVYSEHRAVNCVGEEGTDPSRVRSGVGGDENIIHCTGERDTLNSQ